MNIEKEMERLEDEANIIKEDLYWMKLNNDIDMDVVNTLKCKLNEIDKQWNELYKKNRNN